MPRCPKCNSEIPSNKDICTACGEVLTNFAKGKIQEMKKNIKNQKLNKDQIYKDLRTEIATLNKELTNERNDAQKTINDLTHEIDSLKALKDNQRNAAIELIKDEKNKEQFLLLPNWFLILFSIVGIIFLILLIVFNI